jgi:hypothetical protein
MLEAAKMTSTPNQGLCGSVNTTESKRRPQVTIMQNANGYLISVLMRPSYVATTLEEALNIVRGEFTTPDVASIDCTIPA